MDEKDIIERVGPPDEVTTRKHGMRSRIWICSTCQYVVASPEPIPVPAPCPYCGGIAFKAFQGEPR